MKITKAKLKQIIQEELEKIKEVRTGMGSPEDIVAGAAAYDLEGEDAKRMGIIPSIPADSPMARTPKAAAADQPLTTATLAQSLEDILPNILQRILKNLGHGA